MSAASLWVLVVASLLIAFGVWWIIDAASKPTTPFWGIFCLALGLFLYAFAARNSVP